MAGPADPEELKSPIEDDVRMMFRQGKYAESVGVIQEHVAAHRDDVPALELMATALKYSGDKPGAAGALITASELYAEAGQTLASLAAQKKAQGLGVEPDFRAARTPLGGAPGGADEGMDFDMEAEEDLGMDVGADLGLDIGADLGLSAGSGGEEGAETGPAASGGGEAAPPAPPPLEAGRAPTAPADVEPTPAAEPSSEADERAPVPEFSLAPSEADEPEAGAPEPSGSGPGQIGGFEIPEAPAEAGTDGAGTSEATVDSGAPSAAAPSPPSAAGAAPSAGSARATPVERVPTPLFDELSDDEFVEVARGLAIHEYDEGRAIVEEGAEGDSMFVIVRGGVAVLVKKGAGEAEVARLGAGDFFGEAALLSGDPRSATVRALAPTECLELTRSALDAIVEKHPRVRDVLENFHEQRMDSTIDSLIDGLGD